MNINLTLSDEDIMKIFARTEGSMIFDKTDYVMYSTRIMLSNIWRQLPIGVKEEISEKCPRTAKVMKGAVNNG